jgi:hypothetical protein
VNRDRTSIIDATAGALLVVFGSALAATALFFVIERDVYVAGLARALLFIALPALCSLGPRSPPLHPAAAARSH